MLTYASTGTRGFGTKPVPPYARPGWEFYAVLKGRVAPSYPDDRRQAPRSRTLWLFAPGVIHGWIGDRDPARVAVFHFDHVSDRLRKIAGPTGTLQIPIGPADISWLPHAAKEILPRLWESDPLLDLYSERLQAELAILILKKTPVCPQAAARAHALTVVEAAEHWMRLHVHQAVSLERVVCELGVTAGHLRRLFQQVRRRSPKETMLTIQLDRARELLKQTDWKLDVIAAECGFVNTSNFCKRFRQELGVTPTQYRRGSVALAILPRAR